MQNASGFKRLTINDKAEITVFVEGQPIKVSANDTAATALLLSGLHFNRSTPISGSKRAPYCMMGVCFECLIEVDGLENVQGCMLQVAEGMQIKRQHQARRLADDFNTEVTNHDH